MLVHIKDLFKDEVVGKFAYPAFNTQDLETTLGIISGAEELGVPIIIQASEGSIHYAGLETIYEIMATVAARAKIPVALHIDHGKDETLLRHAIELGFSSVMIDHSYLPFEENARDTKAMVEFAHSHGAWVQGEIGKIRGSEDWVSVKDSESLLTDPVEAKKFSDLTSVDTLACSVGTIHGIIKITGEAKPHVDTDRIKQIFELVQKPLVLHGASGVGKDIIRQAISNGIAIINIDTELRMAFSEGLRNAVAEQAKEIDPRKLLKPAIDSVKAAAKQKLIEFNTQPLT